MISTNLRVLISVSFHFHLDFSWDLLSNRGRNSQIEDLVTRSSEFHILDHQSMWNLLTTSYRLRGGIGHLKVALCSAEKVEGSFVGLHLDLTVFLSAIAAACRTALSTWCGTDKKQSTAPIKPVDQRDKIRSLVLSKKSARILLEISITLREDLCFRNKLLG